jgi:hypothetical protein
VIDNSAELDEVDLDDDEESTTERVEVIEKSIVKLSTPTAGISASALLTAASSIEQFRQSYEV